MVRVTPLLIVYGPKTPPFLVPDAGNVVFVARVVAFWKNDPASIAAPDVILKELSPVIQLEALQPIAN